MLPERLNKTNLEDRAFTPKAVLAGLFGTVMLCALAVYNADRLRQPNFLGSSFPAAAVCYVLLLGTVWNSAWARVRAALTFARGELVVVLGCCLMACGFVNHGLFRTFYTAIVVPWFHLSSRPAWQRYEVLGQLPTELQPMAGRTDDVVYGGFVQGLGSGQTVALWDLPWGAWGPALLHWLPLFICLGIALVGFALVLHRQWAHHEQLAYPLAAVLSSLFERAPGRAIADLFGQRLFWCGFLPVFGLHLYNLIELWMPEIWPRVQMIYYLNWDALYRLIPTTKHTGFYAVHEIKIFFFLIGITYFLPSSIGFSLGIAQILLLGISTQIYLSTGSPLSAPQLEMQRSGAYLGYAAVLAFTGRHYYWSVLCAAIGRRRGAVPAEQAWAARILIAGAAGFYGLLILGDLDWVPAALFTGLLFTLFMVVTRLVCETGIPIVQAGWQPAGLLQTAIGPAALGLKPLVVLQWLSSIFANDTRENALAYMATALKTADDARLKLRTFGVLLLCAVALTLVAAGTARLWSLYNFGATQDAKLFNTDSTKNLDSAARAYGELDAGQRDEAGQAHGLAKIALFDFSSPNLPWVGWGILAVLVLAALRLRFMGWPLHPVLLMVWGSEAFKNLAYCFLIGWLVKTAVVRFGGGKVYQDLKPLFLGIVLADVVASGASLTWGFLYHFQTGLLPRFNMILPEINT